MFDELKVFLMVAETRSFTKAARQLNFSQPAISQQIKKLEAYFHTALLSRSISSRQVELTDSGRLVCRYGQEIVSLLDTLERELSRSRDAAEQPLLIGASMTIGTQLLPLLLRALGEAHGELNPKLFIGNTLEVCERLYGGSIDIGLIEGKSMYHDFRRTDFYTDPMVLVASPALAEDFQEFSPSALGRATWVVREAGSGTAQYLQAFLESNHIMISRQIECNSNEANCELVVEGLGITFISRLAVKRELRSGALRCLPMNRSYTRKFSHITRLDSAPSPAVSAFMDVLTQAATRFPVDEL